MKSLLLHFTDKEHQALKKAKDLSPYKSWNTFIYFKCCKGRKHKDESSK